MGTNLTHRLAIIIARTNFGAKSHFETGLNRVDIMNFDINDLLRSRQKSRLKLIRDLDDLKLDMRLVNMNFLIILKTKG